MLGAQFCVKIIKKGATMEKLILKEGKIIEEKLDLKYFDIDTDAYHERLKSLMDDFSRFEVQPLVVRNKEEIKACYENLIIRDANFRPYYKRASKIAMEYRINKWKKAINKIID